MSHDPPPPSQLHLAGRDPPPPTHLPLPCAGLAVVRGVWRRVRTGRSVPVRAQLRSHRLFAENFEAVADLVDSATLYHTGGHLSTFNKAWEDMAPKVGPGGLGGGSIIILYSIRN